MAQNYFLLFFLSWWCNGNVGVRIVFIMFSRLVVQ